MAVKKSYIFGACAAIVVAVLCTVVPAHVLLLWLVGTTVFLIGLFGFLAWFTRATYTPETLPAYADNKSAMMHAQLAAALEAAHTPPPSAAVGGSFGRDAVQEALAEVVRLLSRDYVEYWYASLSNNDMEFPEIVQEALLAMVGNLSALLREVDVLTFLMRDVMQILREHFRSVRVNPKHFPSHPCLASPDAELLYLRQIADVLLNHLLPAKEKDSPLLVALLRELLACQVLKYCADRFCDPDYINQYIIYRCDAAVSQRQASSRAYAYARDYASFLKMIDHSEDTELLKDIRYNIITEILQAEHVHHIKREARSGAGARLALALVADTEKGAHLSGRDLHRYINQLRHAKSLCERRIVMLGGPDLRDAADLSGERELQTLSAILADGLALGYFAQHLREQRLSRCLNFWLMCRAMRESAPAVTGSSVEMVCDGFDSGSAEILRVLENEATATQLRNAMDVLHEYKNAPSSVRQTDLDSAVVVVCAVQQIIYDSVLRKQYRGFLLSTHYRNYVRHAGREEERQSKTGPSCEEDDRKLRQELDEVDAKIAQKQAAMAAASESGDTATEDKLAAELDVLMSQKRRLDAYAAKTAEWQRGLGHWHADVGEQQDDEEGDAKFPIMVYRDDKGSRDGWIVYRRFADFEALHRRLQQRGAVTKKLPAPDKPWFALRSKAAQTAHVRKSLEAYLSAVLADSELQRVDDIFAFLCPTARVVNRSLAAEDDFMDEDEGGDEAFVDDTTARDDVARPLYALVEEVFELHSLLKWFRRQLINFVQLTYGGTINRNLRETADWLVEPPQLVYYIHAFRDSMFVPVAPEPRPRTAEDIQATYKEAKKKLLGSLPAVLQSLVGADTCQRGAVKVLNALQCRHTNKHLFYMMLELFVTTLCPSLQRRDISSILIHVDISGETTTNNNNDSDNRSAR